MSLTQETRGSVSVERHAESTRRVSIAARAIDSFRVRLILFPSHYCHNAYNQERSWLQERRSKSAAEKGSKERNTFACGFASLKPPSEEEEEAGGECPYY